MSVSKEEIGAVLRDAVAAQSKSLDTEIVDDGNPPIEGEVESDQEETSETDETDSEIEEDLEKDEENKDKDEEESNKDTSSDSYDVNSLAKAIEVEPEFLYEVKIPMPDGMESISLSELKDDYTELKRTAAAGKDLLEAERAAFEEEKSKTIEEINRQQQVPQEIAEKQIALFALTQQFQSINWEELEKENPGQAALDKQNMILAHQSAQAELQGAVDKHQKEAKERHDAYMTQQRAKMFETIPEWKDDTVRLSDQAEMRTMLKGYGYEDNQITNITDSRALKMARDLWLLQRKSKKALETTQRLLKIPKPLKSGARNPIANSSSKKTGKIIEQGKEAKTDREKASYIANILPKKLR